MAQVNHLPRGTDKLHGRAMVKFSRTQLLLIEYIDAHLLSKEPFKNSRTNKEQISMLRETTEYGMTY